MVAMTSTPKEAQAGFEPTWQAYETCEVPGSSTALTELSTGSCLRLYVLTLWQCAQTRSHLASSCSSAHPGIRTLTVPGLNRLPLPIGLDAREYSRRESNPQSLRH